MKNYIFLFLLTITIYSCSTGGNYYPLSENMPPQINKLYNNKATVVFVRPADEKAVTPNPMPVYDGDQLIGGLPGENYFIYYAEPGKHIFACQMLPRYIDFVEADIEGDKTYYVVVLTKHSFFFVRYALVAVKKDSDLMPEIIERLPKLQYAELTEEGRIKFSDVELEKERNEFLEEVKETNKPKLLTEDGI